MSSLPKRYLKGVNKEQRIKDIESRKKSDKPLKQLFPKKSDKEALEKKIVKPSTYTTKFKKLYPDTKYSLSGFSEKFNIPLEDLKEVEKKGIRAWKTSGSRPGVPAIAWGKARVYKFILIEEGKVKKKIKDPDNYLHKKV